MTVKVDMNDPRLQGSSAPMSSAQPHGRSRDPDDPSSPYAEAPPKSRQEKCGSGYMHESPASDGTCRANRHEEIVGEESLEKAMGLETGNSQSSDHRKEKLADGSVFEGQFNGRDRHGWGKFTWSTGGSYSGQFEGNDMHGEGTYTWSDGSFYAGQWQRNNMGPRGVMEWTDGRKYDGDFYNGKKHGDGQLTWPDGRSYNGQWEAGKQHGTGITVTGKGVSRRCQWEHGKLVRWLDDRVEPDMGGTPLKSSTANTSAGLRETEQNDSSNEIE